VSAADAPAGDAHAADAAPPPIEELPSGWTPRAVVLDLDGTVVDDDLRVHPRARAAIRAAAERLPVIVATGRMFRSARPWAVELDVTQPLVCYQGALIRGVGTGDAPGDVVYEQGLDGDVAVDALEIARRAGWHRQAYHDDELVCEEDRPEAHVYARIAQVPIRFVDDLLEVARRGTTKLVFVSTEPAVVDECVATMTRELEDRARVTRSTAQFVEVVDPRVNKAAAIDMVCERLGLHLADAVAVGDAPNDVEMIARAGCGVVVRGARPEVLAVAAATCAAPDAAGVADVLQHFGLVD
jgi:Cof subfamily protein (haloacid dehalogenase superfamily)